MIQERIITYLESKGLSKYHFYKDTGLSNGFLDKKGTIGVDKCELIISVYPDISVKWLITGKGKMILEEESEKRVEENKPPDGHEIYAKVLLERIEELTLEVNELNKELEEIRSKSHYKYMNIAEEQEKYNSPKKE